MGQRQPKGPPKAPSPYKYQSVAECEEHEDQHVVKPTSWPPRRIGNIVGDPSMSLRCELCGGWLVVYKAHATGELAGVKVIMPEGMKAKQPA